jgi:ATP adenylyltransferase
MASEPGNPRQPPERDALHAPWRYAYMESLSANLRARRAQAHAADAAPDSFLGAYWRSPERDPENHVVARVGDGPGAGMILLNRYPYAGGHLLVALADSRPRLLDYDAEQRAALWRLVDQAVELVEAALDPQGVNVGLNQGQAAGAGVPGHLHAHVIPRWAGDVNFIDVVARVRVIPSALDDVAAQFRAVWSRLRARV